LKAATPDDFYVRVTLLPLVSVLMKYKNISVKDNSPFSSNWEASKKGGIKLEWRARIHELSKLRLDF
jgi:uncharacterized membrane protein